MVWGYFLFEGYGRLLLDSVSRDKGRVREFKEFREINDFKEFKEFNEIKEINDFKEQHPKFPKLLNNP